MPREKLSYAQKQCVAATGKLMQQTAMIGPGARVGVAVSGGMDSWALLQVLKLRQRTVPFRFEIMALHVNPGFDPHSHAALLPWLRENGVAAHIELADHGPAAHSPANRSNSPCFYCAKLRRARLFALCRQYGLTHLAFGHNADDLVTTFFMNLVQTGRVDGMSMKEPFFAGRLTVIRPMMLVEKSVIARAVKHWNLPVWTNPCPSAFTSRRSGMAAEVQELCKGSKFAKANIFSGLIRWQLGLTPSDQ